VHLRRRPQTYNITEHSLRSILAFSIFRNVFSEIVTLSSLGESEDEDIGSDTKILTTLRMIIDRLCNDLKLELRLQLRQRFEKG